MGSWSGAISHLPFIAPWLSFWPLLLCAHVKTIIILLVGLLVGVGFGWYFGYTRPLAKADRDARKEMLKTENDDWEAALFAVKAIPLVESGDKQGAVEWLAKPIGSYYRVYGPHAGTNEERLKMLAMIEQLAGTNPAVNTEIHGN